MIIIRLHESHITTLDVKFYCNLFQNILRMCVSIAQFKAKKAKRGIFRKEVKREGNKIRRSRVVPIVLKTLSVR